MKKKHPHKRFFIFFSLLIFILTVEAILIVKFKSENEVLRNKLEILNY